MQEVYGMFRLYFVNIFFPVLLHIFPFPMFSRWNFNITHQSMRKKNHRKVVGLSASVSSVFTYDTRIGEYSISPMVPSPIRIRVWDTSGDVSQPYSKCRVSIFERESGWRKGKKGREKGDAHSSPSLPLLQQQLSTAAGRHVNSLSLSVLFPSKKVRVFQQN